MLILKRFFSAALPLVLMGAAPAANTPLQLYEKGEYLAAADAAEAENTGASLALAARATLADETLRATRCLDCLKRAEAFARRGIAKDPKEWEGYIELAASLGYEARLLGLLRSQFANFADQAKEAVDAGLKIAPGDPWALAASGGWNIEVARSGMVARMLYGASGDDGIASYRKALGIDPGNLVISFSYALALTSYAFEDKRIEIMAVLEATARGKPADAYAAAMKARAQKLLDLLTRDKREDYLTLVRDYMGFP